jgi:hypothetical protein
VESDSEIAAVWHARETWADIVSLCLLTALRTGSVETM